VTAFSEVISLLRRSACCNPIQFTWQPEYSLLCPTSIQFTSAAGVDTYASIRSYSKSGLILQTSIEPNILNHYAVRELE
jgi:hypothetical protein